MLDKILCTLTTWQPLAVFISAFVGIVLAFFAIYGDRIRAFVSRPKLDLLPGPFYPDSEKIPITRTDSGAIVAEAAYLQFFVVNHGRTSAEKVEVYVEKLEKEINGIFQEVKEYFPLSLVWRHSNTDSLERLSPESRRACTLGRIVDPAKRSDPLIDDAHPRLNLSPDRSPFRLELSYQTNTRSDLLEPGKYRLFLEIGGSNVRRPKKKILELEFTGEWLSDPRNMAVARIVG
jgi:hypothetical protein